MFLNVKASPLIDYTLLSTDFLFKSRYERKGSRLHQKLLLRKQKKYLRHLLTSSRGNQLLERGCDRKGSSFRKRNVLPQAFITNLKMRI